MEYAREDLSARAMSRALVTKMNIKLNGQDLEIGDATTLAALLGHHGVTAETTGVAVAVNDTVVPRRDWAARVLAAGDRVEIVRAVQGG